MKRAVDPGIGSLEHQPPLETAPGPGATHDRFEAVRPTTRPGSRPDQTRTGNHTETVVPCPTTL